MRKEVGLAAQEEGSPNEGDRKWPRRVLIGMALLPGSVAFVGGDYLLSRSWLWAFLVVPMVVGSIAFLVWFDRHSKS
jgi:hypothetical protein